MPDEELQDPQQWDFERAEKRRGVKRSRAIVSVAFSRHDYERVVEAAERRGMKTSEFIRSAALEHARRMPFGGMVFLSAYSVTTDAYWSCIPDLQEGLVSSWTASAFEPV